MSPSTNAVHMDSSAQKILTSPRGRTAWIALAALALLRQLPHSLAWMVPKPMAHQHRFGWHRIQFSSKATYSSSRHLWFSNNDNDNDNGNGNDNDNDSEPQPFANGNQDDSQQQQQQQQQQHQQQQENGDYQERLARLDETIAKAEAERKRLLRFAGDRDKAVPIQQQQDEESTWIPVPVEEWTPRVLQRPPLQLQDNPLYAPTRTRSKVSRSDAGTLVIEITPQGISSGMLFSGAFSVAWFSAIVPATVTALSGGLLGVALFLLPFWAAGGMVAKQALVDPFVSHTVTMGRYAWSVEKRGAVVPKKQEGSTADLQGAKVECPMIVNNVPQYQLNLYSSGRTGMTSLGAGLPKEELQKVAAEINSYLKSLSREEEEEDASFQ